MGGIGKRERSEREAKGKGREGRGREIGLPRLPTFITD